MKTSMVISRRALCFALAGLSLLATAQPVAHARQLFAEKFDVTLPVVSELSQVIYYREHSARPMPAGANVYVDGEFHTTLLPGGFSAFCLRPGVHRLGAYFGEKALYPGKTSYQFEATLGGGKTYFLRVSEEGAIQPQPVRRGEAEARLKSIFRQSHMLSRASAVVPCVYDREREQKTRQYTIDTRVLFGPDNLKSGEITAQGREAIGDLALTIRQDLNRINKVTILDNRDGRQLSAALLQARAQAIREQLIKNAIPASILSVSQEESASLASECTSHCGAPQQQIVVHAR